MTLIYVISDVHGCYEQYRALLEKICFNDTDTLYVLGDVIDRKPGGVRVLQDMMLRPNVIPILGNHEFMAATCLPWLMGEITKENLEKLDNAHIGALRDWLDNGGGPTLRALRDLRQEEREDILAYIRDFSLYEEIEVNGRSFLLVHAGLEGFAPDKTLEEYRLEDFLFSRPEPDTVYWPDRIVIFGHTPTWYRGSENRILRRNTWIDIDCGCGSGGPLACLCLDTMGEFYAWEGES